MYKNREELLKELEELSRKEAMQAECLDAAKQLYDIMSCFVEAGFTVEQAFEIILHMLSGGNQAPTLGNVLGAIFN